MLVLDGTDHLSNY